MTPDRGLGLDGAPNARDLGGLVTADGRRVRPGRLYRAGTLGYLTDDDLPRLRALDLRTVIDLRDLGESALSPPDRLPGPAPRVVPLPIYDPAHPVFTYVTAVLLGDDGDDGYAALAEEGTPFAMAALYRWFVTGEAAQRGFGAAVRLLAREGDLPAMVHCSVGKDRTGWLSAVVLTALGVPRAEVEADYLATNAAMAGVNERIVAAMREQRPDLDAEAVRPVLAARIDYLRAAFDEVDRVYRGFDNYLRHGLGLDDEALHGLRAGLLDGAGH